MQEVINGTTVIIAAAFEVDGTPADPTNISFLYRKPDGTISTYVYNGVGSIIVRNSAGVYSAPVNIDDEGYWSFRWVGTDIAGTSDIAQESEILCVDSQFTE